MAATAFCLSLVLFIVGFSGILSAGTCQLCLLYTSSETRRLDPCLHLRVCVCVELYLLKPCSVELPCLSLLMGTSTSITYSHPAIGLCGFRKMAGAVRCAVVSQGTALHGRRLSEHWMRSIQGVVQGQTMTFPLKLSPCCFHLPEKLEYNGPRNHILIIMPLLA